MHLLTWPDYKREISKNHEALDAVLRAATNNGKNAVTRDQLLRKSMMPLQDIRKQHRDVLGVAEVCGALAGHPTMQAAHFMYGALDGILDREERTPPDLASMRNMLGEDLLHASYAKGTAYAIHERYWAIKIVLDIATGRHTREENGVQDYEILEPFHHWFFAGLSYTNGRSTHASS